MISFNQFVEYMRKEMEKKFQGRLAMKVEKVKKNNGVVIASLLGKRKDNEEWLSVCLDSYYAAYKEGMDLGQLAEDIYDMFNTFEKPGYPLEELEDFEKAKDKIFYKLVNYDKNLDTLKETPHIPYLDLAVVFCVMVERNEKGQSTSVVTHECRKKWGKDIETLYARAKENTPRLFPVSLCSMGQVMEEWIKESNGNGYMNLSPEDLVSPEKSSLLFVLSNTCGVYGAMAMLYPDILKNFSEMAGSDIVILPSSVHEVLLLPNIMVHDMDGIKKMVEHVNRTEVPVTDILSDHVLSI